MSASSSDVDVGPGAGGWVGSALAVPIANAESPIAAPATAAHSHRIASFISLLACATSISLLACAKSIPLLTCAVTFPLLHSSIPCETLAPDRIRRMPNATNVFGLSGSTRMQEGFERMWKGFREFLARGNIVDLAVAVVIGTAFTALVTKFTDSIIQPLINRIGAGPGTEYGILRIDIGGGQAIDLNILLSATINFVLIAAVVYFLVVLPYNKLFRRNKEEEAATEVTLLTEIRDLLSENGSSSGKHVTGDAETARADKS